MKEQTAEAMMERTKELIRKEGFQREHAANPQRDFIRRRKLGFPETMIYVLGNCRESMELNAEKFAEAAKLESVSAAALCKARAKIGWEVFEECAAPPPVGNNVICLRLSARLLINFSVTYPLKMDEHRASAHVFSSTFSG